MEKALSQVTIKLKDGTEVLINNFEQLQEIMSLHSTNEEEYLTNTNKLYETNKLLNQVA
jgi:hypothetical protein